MRELSGVKTKEEPGNLKLPLLVLAILRFNSLGRDRRQVGEMGMGHPSPTHTSKA